MDICTYGICSCRVIYRPLTAPAGRCESELLTATCEGEELHRGVVLKDKHAFFLGGGGFFGAGLLINSLVLPDILGCICQSMG